MWAATSGVCRAATPVPQVRDAIFGANLVFLLAWSWAHAAQKHPSIPELATLPSRKERKLTQCFNTVYPHMLGDHRPSILHSSLPALKLPRSDVRPSVRG